MARIEPTSSTVAIAETASVTGEQDIANVGDLSARFAQAAALGNVDVFVDLSGVDFMDASTVGAILTLRRACVDRSARLCVLAPSAVATRVLGACGLLTLLQCGPALESKGTTALPATGDRAGEL